jgi:hypothetical protein
MATCEPFNNQALDFVYGLLDEAAAQAFRAHLEACLHCKEALAAAQQQQMQFALAALPIGPQEVPAFAPPSETAPASPPTIPLARPAAPARRFAGRRRWIAWAAAAVILLVAGTLGYVYHDGTSAREAWVATQQESVRHIDTQLAALEPAFKADTKELEVRLRDKVPPQLYVLAPTQIPPDGHTVVQVATNDVAGNPVNSKVTVTLTDGKNVLARNETVAINGTACVGLGDGLNDALHGCPSVQLIAEAEVGQSRCRVQETLRVAAPGYVTHLVTNKTIYRPGDVLMFRALVLDRSGLTPPAVPIALRVSLADAKGNLVAAAETTCGAGGIAAGDLAVAPKFADGEYELRVAALQPGTTEVRPHTRKLQVAREVTSEVQADRDRYRAGDIVKLEVPRSLAQGTQNKLGNSQDKAPNSQATPNFEVLVNNQRVPLLNSAVGGGGAGMGGFAPPGANATGPTAAPPNAPPQTQPVAPAPAPPVAATSTPQGQQGFGTGNLSSLSPMNLEFALPKDLDTNRARVRILLTEGGKVKETFEQDLDVVPSKLAVDLLPEGGDLIARVPNRVYYRVRTPRGEPVNPEGRVIVLSGSEVLFDSAPGEGSGSFTFTPQPGEIYSIRLTRPDGPTSEFTEPFARMGGVHATGLVLHTPKPVAAAGEPFEVVLRNPTPQASRRVLLVAQCRGRFVGQQWVDLHGPNTSVAMGTLDGAHGLVRLTAYEAGAGALKPLAERLVYRMPQRRLELTAFYLGGVIAPRANQKSTQLQVRARNEAGDPAQCWLTAVVADERYRTREPNPITHFFIAGDVRSGEDLDDATLLAADTPAARQSLDVFLGTAGWRHFEPAAPRDVAGGVAADAALVGLQSSSPRALEQRHEAEVKQAIEPVRIAVEAKHADLTRQREAAQALLETARATLREYQALPAEYLRMGLGAATTGLLALACLALCIGAWRLVRRHQATLLFGGSFACLGLCLVATLVLLSLSPTTELRDDRLTEAMDGLAPWLHFVPRIDVPTGSPTGPVVLGPTAPHMAERVDRVMADATLRDDGNDKRLADLGEGKKHASLQRGAGPAPQAKDAKHDGDKKGPHADVVAQYLKRYQQALDEQAAYTVKPKLGAIAPDTGPGATLVGKGKGGPETKARANPVLAQKEAEQLAMRRAWVYEKAPGLEHDTLLWHPSLFLASGSTQVAFDVPSSAGSYRVLLFGQTADGRLGFYEGRLDVQPDLGR